MEESYFNSLKDTLKRVEKAVNQRFEKDADLYIAKDDLEWLKKKLREGNYELITTRLKSGLAPEALSRVIIENAWLLPNDRYRPLLKIIEKCRHGYMGNGNIMRGILEDKYDLPKDFRDKLAEICFDEMDSSIAEKILYHGVDDLPILHNPNLRLRCLRLALAPLDSLEVYRRFKDFAKGNDELYANTQWSLLNTIFNENVLTDNVLDEVFDDCFMTDSATGYYKYWRNVFAKRCAPNALTERVERKFISNSNNYEVCMHLWFRIVPAIQSDEMMDNFISVLYRVAPIWHSNRMDKLGQLVVNKLQDYNPKFADKAVQVFNSVGISVQLSEEKNLPIEYFVERIEGAVLTDRDIFHLSNDFRKTYWQQKPIEKLDTIAENLQSRIGHDNFEKFCCKLAEKNPRFLPYLLYVIDNFTTPETVKAMLQVIKNNDIWNNSQLRNSKTDLDKVANFVKDNDFELFIKMKS